MTEPDEALLYAREDFAKLFRSRKSHTADYILSGVWDDEADVRLPALGYRAGAAASEARIEALKEALRAWVEKECDFMRRNNLGNPEVQPHVIWSRALLKEPRND